MPELPEVERASALLCALSLGHRIDRVDTVEDSIVFSDITHTEFASEVTGRKVTNVARYGKVFYIELDGAGRMPVMHFGMTGNLHVKGQKPLEYQSKGNKPDDDTWPPRFMKFILHISTAPPTQIAFTDPRRLSRVRLSTNPLKTPPISTLGFDPILSHPSLEKYTSLLTPRSSPIKAVLLDQTFNAGVGNWVADEILYQSHVHPEVKANELSEGEVKRLWECTRDICKVAVELNADASRFPENWLFRHRWGKGKSAKVPTRGPLLLPSGEPATIKWLTVGGRTSAYVVELQKKGRYSNGKGKAKQIEADDDDDEEEEEEVTPSPKRKRSKVTRVKKTATTETIEAEEEESTASKRPRRTKKTDASVVVDGGRRGARKAR